MIGTIEVGGLIASEPALSGSFWNLGLVIVDMFMTTWAIALMIWRLARIEERWSAHLRDTGSAR